MEIGFFFVNVRLTDIHVFHYMKDLLFRAYFDLEVESYFWIVRTFLLEIIISLINERLKIVEYKIVLRTQNIKVR